MLIPNSIIVTRAANETGNGPVIAPSYHERILRHVHNGRLDVTSHDRGIDVQPYPENGNPDTRYTEVMSIEQEANHLRKLYKSGPNGPYFDAAFPSIDVFEVFIENMLVAEASRLIAVAKPKELEIVHAGYTRMGVSDDQARSLQSAGYASPADCVGVKLSKLSNVVGISIEVAMVLSSAKTTTIDKGK